MALLHTTGRAGREDEALDRLDVAFEAAMRPWWSSPEPLALLFSGGVDSGLLAWELRRRPNVSLVTVGRAGSPDLAAGRSAAQAIGLSWRGVELTGDVVGDVVARLRGEAEGLSPTARSVLVAFAAALEQAPVGTVLCGQGADELFLGYAHFRGLEATDAARRADADLRALLERDWPLARSLAARSGRTVHAPYLDPGFMDVARGISIPQRLPGDEPKALFRRWAERRGLPAEIARRPKRALQYGSGIDRLLSRADGHTGR